MINVIFRGIWVQETSVTDLKVHQKYLGPNYVNKTNFSLLISNHTSYTDVFLYIAKLAPSFVAKASIGGVPIIGECARLFESLFVNRSDSKNSHVIVNII